MFSVFTKLRCLKPICKVQIPRNLTAQLKNEARVTPDKPQGLVKPRSEMRFVPPGCTTSLGHGWEAEGCCWGRAGGSSGGPSGISELGEAAEGTRGQ